MRITRAAPIVASTLFLLFGLALTRAEGTSTRAHAILAGPQPAQYLVLFVLDGGRPDYFGLTNLPHVDALRRNGTQFTNAIDGILETETPSGHTTLATGSTPRRDGILGFSWAQNDNDFSLFSPTTIRAGVLEDIVRNAHVPTIAGLYKARFPRATVVALSGHKYYAADPLGGPDADAIMYYQTDTKGRYVPVAIPGHVPPAGVLDDPTLAATGNLGDGGEDHLAANLALRTFAVMRPHVMLINLPEFDWPLGHVYGGDLARTHAVALMRGFDRDLGRIEQAYGRAGVLSKTVFAITADHGMEQVKHFIPYTVFTDAVTAAGTSPTSIAYNQSAYLWLHDPTKAEAVAENLVQSKTPGILAVYYAQRTGNGTEYVRAVGTDIPIALEQTYQYLLQTLVNGHEPQVVVFCDSTTTTSSDQTHWLGDHGGQTWQSQHIPLILSGKGVRAHQVIAQPVQLDDVAPTVLTDLGVAPRGMEGIPLTDALVQQSAGDLAARNREANQLWSVVRPLQAEDAREMAQSGR